MKNKKFIKLCMYIIGILMYFAFFALIGECYDGLAQLYSLGLGLGLSLIIASIWVK